jgi:hypothetical protein
MAWWNGPALVGIVVLPFLFSAFIFEKWGIPCGAAMACTLYFMAYEFSKLKKTTSSNLQLTCWPIVINLLNHRSEKSGGWRRNRTIRTATSHSQSMIYIITGALKIKGLLHYVNDNSNLLFLTPFYS